MGGPEPIKLQEVLAYFEIVDIRDRATRRRYLDLIQMMDGVYLEHAAAQAEARSKSAG